MKKNKLYQLTLILITFLLLFITGCKSSPKFKSGFHSMEELADYAIPAMIKGDRAAFNTALVSKQEFIESIHPYTPESKSLSGEDKWRIFTGTRRAGGIRSQFNNFAEETGLVYDGIGNPKTVLDYGDLRLHRRVPVYIKRQKNAKIIKDTAILGVVAEKDGLYKIVNVFRD